jgi:hypothetical protein
MKWTHWLCWAAVSSVLTLNLSSAWSQTSVETRLGSAQPNARFTQVSLQDTPPIPAPAFDPRSQPPAPEVAPIYVPDYYEDVDEPWSLFPQDRLVQVYGWLSGGVTFNGRRTTDKYNGPLSFNDRRNELMLNQLYTVIEKPIDTRCGFDIGGRIDLLFGTDYVFTESAGLETRRDFSPKWNNRTYYGLSMPQIYAELGYGDLSVKLGHFYTIIGYEVVTAPDNFFYSHAYTMQYGEPFTHTGALATWEASDNWTLVGGIVDRWDSFNPLDSRAHFLGGIAFTPDDERFSLAFSIVTGDEEVGDRAPTFENLTMYSIVFSYEVTDRLQYVLQHDLGVQQIVGGSERWFGINQYLFYTINDCWKAGMRVEWFRDNDGARVAAVRETNPTSDGEYIGDFYEISLGLNWTPTKNFALRPEVRWDWFSGEGTPYDGRNDMFTAGVDAILMW